MRTWFDTEFVEDGSTIDLISIGMVREDGGTLYLESSECDLGRASAWVKANVVPHLKGGSARVSRRVMAQRIREFVGPAPELWAYFADYDWVALCQLYGTMMQLPEGWPMFCLDVQQLAHLAGGHTAPEKPSDAHHALADALWARDYWRSFQAPANPQLAAYAGAGSETLSSDLFGAPGEITTHRSGLRPAALWPSPRISKSTLIGTLVPDVPALIDALQPLVDIADAYDDNALDDEARKFYGQDDEIESGRDPATIEMVQGRGGRRLLTLAQCLKAREVARQK